MEEILQQNNSGAVSTVDTILAGMPAGDGSHRRIDLTQLRSSVSNLADGVWLQDTNMQVGCLALQDCQAQLPCLNRMLVLGIDGSRQLQNPKLATMRGIVAKLAKLDASVGVLGNDLHWCAYVVMRPATMYVFDSMPGQTVRYKGRWTGGDITWRNGSHIPPSNMASIFKQHCHVWVNEGDSVELCLVQLGQQHDGWFCGRWALANLAALMENICGHFCHQGPISSAVASKRLTREYATASNMHQVQQLVMRLMHLGYCCSSPPEQPIVVD